MSLFWLCTVDWSLFVQTVTAVPGFSELEYVQARESMFHDVCSKQGQTTLVPSDSRDMLDDISTPEEVRYHNTSSLQCSSYSRSISFHYIPWHKIWTDLLGALLDYIHVGTFWLWVLGLNISPRYHNRSISIELYG